MRTNKKRGIVFIVILLLSSAAMGTAVVVFLVLSNIAQNKEGADSGASGNGKVTEGSGGTNGRSDDTTETGSGTETPDSSADTGGTPQPASVGAVADPSATGSFDALPAIIPPKEEVDKWVKDGLISQEQAGQILAGTLSVENALKENGYDIKITDTPVGDGTYNHREITFNVGETSPIETITSAPSGGTPPSSDTSAGSAPIDALPNKNCKDVKSVWICFAQESAFNQYNQGNSEYVNAVNIVVNTVNLNANNDKDGYRSKPAFIIMDEGMNMGGSTSFAMSGQERRPYSKFPATVSRGGNSDSFKTIVIHELGHVIDFLNAPTGSNTLSESKQQFTDAFAKTCREQNRCYINSLKSASGTVEEYLCTGNVEIFPITFVPYVYRPSADRINSYLMPSSTSNNKNTAGNDISCKNDIQRLIKFHEIHRKQPLYD